MGQDKEFRGKRILVIGATGGIGNATSQVLIRRGAEVVLAGRDKEKIEAIAGDLDCQSMVIDAADSDSLMAQCQELAKEEAGLYGIVNCAGSLLLKPAHITSQEEWDSTLAANLTTAFSTVRAAGRVLSKIGGSVVLISSAAARTGLPNHEAIAAAKAGVIGLTLSAAATYAKRKIRFNCVAPGMVRTPLTEGMLSKGSAEEQSKSMHPLGRIGEPNDVARAIVWLLSPEQDWVTGQILGVDGGVGVARSA